MGFFANEMLYIYSRNTDTYNMSYEKDPDCTVFTDALYKSEIGKGAGAAILFHGKNVVKLKRVYDATDINAAEARIIYLGVRLAQEKFSPNFIEVKTDSLNVIRSIRNGRNAKDEFQTELDRISGYYGSQRFALEFQHVKAHRVGGGLDGFWNREADRLAQESIKQFSEE